MNNRTQPEPQPAFETTAIYRDGVLYPSEPLALPPETVVTLRGMVAPETQSEQSAATVASDAPATNGTSNSSVSVAAPASKAAPPFSKWLPVGVRIGLLVPALLLAASGQYLFTTTDQFSWTAAGFYLVAMLLFGLSVSSEHPFRSNRAAQQLDSADRSWSLPKFMAALQQSGSSDKRWRWLALAGAISLSAVLLYLLQLEPPLETYTWGLLLWLGAIGFYLVAVAPISGVTSPRTGWRARWQQARPLVLTVAGITFVALVLRVVAVGELPQTLGGDEGSQGIEALKVLSGEISNPFGTGWLGVPSMSFYFNALTVGTLGNTAFALRLPWALVGTVTIPFVFLLVRRLTDTTMALVTTTLLAVYHYHIHFSRLGSNQIADAFFVVLALWLLYRGYDERRPIDWALCGVVIGAGQYFYAGSRFAMVLVASLIAFFVLRDGLDLLRSRYRELLALLGGVLVAGAPMFQYAYRFPEDYNARLTMVGVFQSGWIISEQDVRGVGPLELLWDQFQRAILAFNLYPDRTSWYGNPEPLLDPIFGVLFLLGAGYAIVHIFNRRLFPMVAWWGGATILGGALTDSPPSSQRLTSLAVPAMFFIALALIKLGQMILQSAKVQDINRWLRPYLAAAVMLFAVLSLRWYFVEFPPTYRYGSYNGVVATAIADYAHEELDEDWLMVFLGPPRMYIGYGTIPYLVPDISGVDINITLNAPIDVRYTLPDNKNLVFLILPERRAELDFIRQSYPNGTLTEVDSPVPGVTDPLFLIYRVPVLEQRSS